MKTIVSKEHMNTTIHAENATWIDRSKSKLSNHRCSAVSKIRPQLYHSPLSPSRPVRTFFRPIVSRKCICLISISRRQAIALFWRSMESRQSDTRRRKKMHRDYLARDISLFPFPKRQGPREWPKSSRTENQLRNDRPSCRSLSYRYTEPAEHPRRISALWVRLSPLVQILRNSLRIAI